MLDSLRVSRESRNHRSVEPSRRLVLLAVFAISLSLALVSCSSEEPLGYASLGDSLAAGVGSTVPSEKSYAAIHRERLEDGSGREVTFRQLGLSGETARSFIGDYPQGESQLVRAERFLGEHPGSRVTLSLGGNDLLRVSGDNDRERGEAISSYGEDLEFILQTLNDASDPPPRITVLSLYNPDPGSLGERWISAMNEEIRATARGNGATVAEGQQAFDGNTEKYLRHYESGERDIHPNDRGYEALARAIAQARSRTRSTRTAGAAKPVR